MEYICWSITGEYLDTSLKGLYLYRYGYRYRGFSPKDLIFYMHINDRVYCFEMCLLDYVQGMSRKNLEKNPCRLSCSNLSCKLKWV